MDEFRKDLDDYFCRFTFGQFVTLILIEVVTLFFVFYLGARYGSDLLGTAEPRKEAVVPGTNPKSVNDIVGTPPMDYTYPEVLTSRDGQKAIRIKPSGVTADEYDRQKAEDPAAIVRRDTPQEVKRPAAPAVVKPAPAPPVEPERTEEPVVEDAPPPEVPAPVEAVKPPATDVAKPKGKFSIQVGSYQSSDEAAAALGNWKKKGYSAFTAVGKIPDKGTWYRVRIGGFPSREEAQKFLDKFKAKEKASALVVLTNS